MITGKECNLHLNKRCHYVFISLL